MVVGQAFLGGLKLQAHELAVKEQRVDIKVGSRVGADANGSGRVAKATRWQRCDQRDEVILNGLRIVYKVVAKGGYYPGACFRNDSSGIADAPSVIGRA